MDFATMEVETFKWIIIGFFLLFAFVSMHLGWLKMSNNHEKIQPYDYVWLGFLLIYLLFF